MTTLMLDEMRTLHGAEIGRRKRGQYCGTMLGSLFGAAYLFGPVPAAFIYMFMPVVCLLDYAL